MLKKHEQFLLSFNLNHLHSSLHTRFQQLWKVWQKGMCKREHLCCCLQEVPATPSNGSSSGLGNACLSLTHDRCSINLFQEKEGTEKWAKGEKEEKGKKENEEEERWGRRDNGGEYHKLRVQKLIICLLQPFLSSWLPSFYQWCYHFLSSET